MEEPVQEYTSPIKEAQPKPATSRPAAAKPATKNKTGGFGAKSKPTPKTPEQLKAEQKNARIEELGNKIEKQRKQAEQKTDAMVTTHVHEPRDNYDAAQTRQALQDADNTAARMDELQRRIDQLRQSQTVVEVQTTEKISREQDHLLRTNQSSTHTHSNQEIKRQSHETHEANPTQAPTRQEKAPLPEYKTAPKPPVNTKYDEDEVRAALSGLKSAMDDLQSHIENRDDEPKE